MRGVSLVLSLVAAFAPWSAIMGQAADTDAFVASQGGDDFLLREAVTRETFADPAIERGLLRVGLEQGCLAVDAARQRAVDANSARFRPHLIAAMRAIVPADQLATGRTLLIGLTHYKARVAREAERLGADVVGDAVAATRTELTRDLTTAPPAAANRTAGRFADWDLANPLAVRTACMIIATSRNDTSEQFQAKKRAFDGFFLRQGD